MESKRDYLSGVQKRKLQKQRAESLKKLQKIDTLFKNPFTNKQPTEFECEPGNLPGPSNQREQPTKLECGESERNVNPSGPSTSNQNEQQTELDLSLIHI